MAKRDAREPELPATETGESALQEQPTAPPQAQEGECQITPQGEDVFFVRYTWAGQEQAHNVRRSSLQRKVAALRKALEGAQGEERQRLEGLLQRQEHLLSRLPAE